LATSGLTHVNHELQKCAVVEVKVKLSLPNRNEICVVT